MIRNSLLAGLATVSILVGTAHAQGVEVAPLAAPDLFSTGGRDTGLPADLWRGASARTLGVVLPLIATKPLSPASAALARRLTREPVQHILGHTGFYGLEILSDARALIPRTDSEIVVE
ncbi:MAG: hypothetical protein Q8M88_13035, partial [Phenylobacterium sp.]|nr:hypothetical protein [Phenylobacterium sp.]